MLLNQIKNLIIKEITFELRQKYAINGILLYVVSTIFISYLSFKKILNPSVWNALFWIILLFASVNAVSKSFMQESKGRLLYLYTIASPRAVIVSKTIYNAMLMICLSLACFVFYSLFIGSMVQDVLLFLIVLLLGSVGFASVLTLMSAVASKTDNNFSLMAILSFPIMLPLLITLIKVSKNAIDGLAWSVSYQYLLVLFFLNVIIWALSYLLFPYLWRD